LNGPPGKLALDVVFVGKNNTTDVMDARNNRVAGSKFDGSEDAHFEVGRDSFHGRIKNLS